MKRWAWIALVVWLRLGLFVCTAGNRQRWYYTGNFNFEQTEEEFFEGATLDLFALYNHQAEDQSYLYSGGLLLLPYNSLESRDNATFNLEPEDKTFVEHIVESSNLEIKSTSSYKIYLNSNYHRIPRMGAAEVLQAEIGLFDHDQEIYLEKKFNNISIGTIHASLVLVPVEKKTYSFMLHKVMWTWDAFRRNSILHHTWHPYSSIDEDTTRPVEETSVCDAATSVSEFDSKNLRIMTYNLWHNNPPSWVYHDNRRRWERYEKRILHFAEQIVLEDPDLIAIQEVRLDSSFFHPNKIMNFWNSNRDVTKFDSGSQIEHLLRAIDQKKQELLTEEERDQRLDYQVLYHPSMLQVDRGRIMYRNEEGLLLLSKFPIVAAEALFLPREVGHKNDDHQRVALIMQVDVQDALQPACSVQGSNSKEQIVTLVTSHFSLHAPSRELGVMAIRRHLNRIDHTHKGAEKAIEIDVDNSLTTSEHTASHVMDTNPSSGVIGESGPAISVRPSMAEILLGDFNAEPHEDTIVYLLTPLVKDTLNPDDKNEVPFIDLWTSTHPDHQESNEMDSNQIERRGLTFPACNPIKRIDFIFMRCPALAAALAAGDAESLESQWTVEATEMYVTGQNATKDTEHLVGSRLDLGMNDLDSPIWASDHFAVVATLRFHPPPLPPTPYSHRTNAIHDTEL